MLTFLEPLKPIPWASSKELLVLFTSEPWKLMPNANQGARGGGIHLPGNPSSPKEETREAKI